MKYEWRKPEEAAEIIAPGEICIGVYPANYFIAPVFVVRRISSAEFEPLLISYDGIDWHNVQPLFVLQMPPIPKIDEK